MSLKDSSILGTQSSTSTSTTSPSLSKARLLFNSDGSVKLLGDPSMFPGFGIDGQSHVLVPTVGVDGKMTMLLAPMNGNGKTFLLNPTNGASLPSPKSVMHFPTIKPPLTFAKSEVSEYKNAPSVLTSAEVKYVPRANQTSLLTNPKFMTHMVIDPSGTRTSKIQMPVHTGTTTTSTSQTDLTRVSSLALPNTGRQMVVSNALKVIAENLDRSPVFSERSSDSISGLGISDGSCRVFKVQYRNTEKSRSETVTSVVSNNQWTRLDSLIPLSYSASSHTPAIDNPGGKKSSKGSGGYLVVPSATPVSSIDAHQKPSNSLPVVLVTKPKSQSPYAAPVPTVMLAHSYSARMNGTQSVGARDTSILSSMPSDVSYQDLYSLLSKSAKTSSNKSIHPTAQIVFSAKTNSNPSPKCAVRSLENKLNTPVIDTTDLLAASLVSMASSIGNTKTPTGYNGGLDPVTGVMSSKQSCVDTEADGILSIKIDSVFSLAANGEDQYSPTRKRKKTGPAVVTKPNPAITIKTEKDVGIATAKLSGEPETITCPPCYVVLEQLSKSQIESDTLGMFKCSNYCRLRTLNFLCELGLVRCEPIVYSIQPDVSPEPVDEKSDLHAFEPWPKVTDVHGSPEKLSPSKGNDEMVYSPEKPASGPDGPTISKVMKVLSPADSTKVIQFVKVENKKREARIPLPISVHSLISKKKGGTAKSLLSSALANVSPPVTTGTTVLAPQTFSNVLRQEGPADKSILTTTMPTCLESPSSSTTIISTSVCNNAVSKERKTYSIFKNSTIARHATLPERIKTVSSKKIPFTITQNGDKKQYYLITVDGKRVLVPNMDIKSVPLTATVATVATSVGVKEPSADWSLNIGHVDKRTTRPSECANDPVPAKVKKVGSTSHVSETSSSLPSGVRIKPEPKTRGYGDEEESTSAKLGETHNVNVKKEIINSEWEEIWSSGATPVENSTDACSPGGNLSSTNPKSSQPTNTMCSDIPTLTSSSNVPILRCPDKDDVMPELPLMKMPSTEADIFKKSSAKGSRIEQLKAVLKEKEMLIEQLKRERVEESSS